MKDEVKETEGNPQNNSKINSSILDAFDSLKAPKDDQKVTGGAKIITLLEISEDDKNLKYTLKRIVRSLGANNPELRTGYFGTLVALLTKFQNVTVTELLELCKKLLHASGSSKSEVGDTALGKILICGAIFRSGLMLKSSEAEQKEVLTLLLSESSKKSYLSTTAYAVLTDFVNGLNEEQFSSVVWSNIKQDLKKDLKDQSLDSLYFLMVVSKKYPGIVKVRKLIGVPKILCEDTVHTISEKIMSGIDLNSASHPIYKELGQEIANSPLLTLFWTSGVDSQLIKHKRNKELVALNILISILNNIKENHEVIPDLLSKNFFKLFMDWFKGLQTASKFRTKNDDEDDQKMMIKREKEVLNALANALKSDKVTTKIRVNTLKKLLFNPGEMNFTEVTGTNIVKSIMVDLDAEGVKSMCKAFKAVLFNTSKKVIKDDVERPWYNNERLKSAELLSYLVSHESVKDDTEFKLSYMKILMCFGFFKIGGDENVAVSGELSGAIKSCFYKCFSSKFSSVDSLVQVLCSLSDFINDTLNKEGVKSKLEKQFSAENMECWDLVSTVCQNIKKNDHMSKIDKVFLILLYQLGLFLFSEPNHVKMSKSSIKELKSCYEHYKKGKKKKNKSNGDISDEEPEWIEVVVEVLLSILSTESSVLRSIVQCVFRLLWEYLTPSCIEQIVSVLDPEDESNPLTEGDTDEESDGESDKEENESEEEKEKEASDGDESDCTVEDEDEDEDMKTPDQLRMAVQKALGAAALDSDAESIDADMIDEEEGKKLDAALAEAFKQYSAGKGKKTKKDRKDKKTLSDFRIRVLDLVDIYLEKDPSMDVCLSMMAPLMRCLEFCILDNQFSELGNRVKKTMKMLSKIRKFSSTDGVTIELLSDCMKATVEKGSKSHFMYQALGDVITQYATFIIHCSQKITVPTVKSPKKRKAPSTSPLAEILKENIHSYFHNRNCMLPKIFLHNILQLDWEENYDLLAKVVESSFNVEVRQFRRNEGLELLTGFFKNLKRIKPTTELLLKKLANVENLFQTTVKTALANEQFTAKNNFIVTLKKLVNIIRQFHESCKISTSLDFEDLLSTIGSFKSTVVANPHVEHNNVKANGPQQTSGKAKKKKRKHAVAFEAE